MESRFSGFGLFRLHLCRCTIILLNIYWKLEPLTNGHNKDSRGKDLVRCFQQYTEKNF